jgi:hypothetical protein
VQVALVRQAVLQPTDLQALHPVFCEVQRGLQQMVVEADWIIYHLALVKVVLPEVQLEQERSHLMLAVRKEEVVIAQATGAAVAVVVLELLVQMQLQLVVSAAMEDRVRLRAHQLLMRVAVVVEVDPIPIHQLPVVQVVQAVAEQEQLQHKPHVFLKMEQTERRT